MNKGRELGSSLQILQTKNKKWYLDKRLIVSPTRNLNNLVYGEETLSYAIMRNYCIVAGSYEEACEYLLGCYAAFIRFYENYMCATRFVWINKDADTPILNNKFGKNQYFIGELEKQSYKPIKEEIDDLHGRTIVVEKDWLIQFRDSLILTSY